MADTRNVVVVGGSASGLGVAHSFLKHTYPALKTSQPSVKYQVHLIEPSTHYWWRIAAPRSIISVPDMPHAKTFLPSADGFKQYDAGAFVFHQAKATSIDTSARTITFGSEGSSDEQTIPYHALVIATGSKTPTPLTSLHGAHTKSIAALDDMNKRIPIATTIVIGGGGPVAVETAGEIGEKLNGRAGWFKSKPDAVQAKITLVTSSNKLLPILSKGYSVKAEKFLNRVGVDVVYNTKVEKADLSDADARYMSADEDYSYGSSGTDKSTIYLSNDEKLTADIYIPATGTKPCTSFLPKDILDEKGNVKVDKQLRVEGAGPRVYTVGDCANNTAGGMMSLQAAVPILANNLANDLAKDGEAPKKVTKDKDFTFKLGQTQVVPVGRSKGVGAFQGNNMPSVAIWAIKGRDYMLWNAKPIVSGSKW